MTDKKHFIRFKTKYLKKKNGGKIFFPAMSLFERFLITKQNKKTEEEKILLTFSNICIRLLIRIDSKGTFKL